MGRSDLSIGGSFHEAECPSSCSGISYVHRIKACDIYNPAKYCNQKNITGRFCPGCHFEEPVRRRSLQHSNGNLLWGYAKYRR